MNCISPPGPEEWQLLAFLDSEADSEIALHLQECSYCRERAETLARIQDVLAFRLDRITCPSPSELGEFHLRLLSPSRMLVISQHLRECPRCAREIERLKDYLSDLSSGPGGSLLRQTKILIARLVSGQEMGQDSDGSPQTPTFAGLRGEGEDEPFIYQADNVRIVIEVQDHVEQMGLKTLLGLVTGLETDEFTIQVSQRDEVVATTSVDEIGNFIISHLAPGDYKLILTGPNMEIHVQSLPV